MSMLPYPTAAINRETHGNIRTGNSKCFPVQNKYCLFTNSLSAAGERGQGLSHLLSSPMMLMQHKPKIITGLSKGILGHGFSVTVKWGELTEWSWTRQLQERLSNIIKRVSAVQNKACGEGCRAAKALIK